MAIGDSVGTVDALLGTGMSTAIEDGVEAVCGNSLAGTNDAPSISRRPAACSAFNQASLRAVGIVAATLHRPSRGPVSLIRTSGGGRATCKRAALGMGGGKR